MKRVTYLENGIRNIRTCDFIDVDEHETICLGCKDGLDTLGRPLYRINVLLPGTVIEKCEDM